MPGTDPEPDHQATLDHVSGTTLNGPQLSAVAAPPGYTLERELGRGGMGIVYLAKQEKLNRYVALKLILAGQHASPAGLARFRTEAELSARFQHPNIVQVFETGEANGMPFLALEFCAGGNLADRMKGTPLKSMEAAQLAETLAHAVQHAHSQGVLHRDLKPSNVIFTRSGQPKLVDFGLAKCLDSQSDKTGSGVVLGTPSYMAPEQAQGRTRDISARTDVYGLGALLYELLTGRPPFRAATPLDTMRQVIENDPVPPRQLQPDVPKDLETICLKCLAKEPAKRYASAQELADDLRRAQAGEPILARPLGLVGKLSRWAGKRPALACLLATLFLTALVFAGEVFNLLRLREHQLRAFGVRKNATDARHIASTVLLRLQRVALALNRAAQQPNFISLMQTRDTEKLRAFCKAVEARGEVAEALMGGQADPVASWLVLDATGYILAVSHDEGVKEPRVPGRDYFHGAIAAWQAAGRPVPHLSRGYRSTNQGLNKFALSQVIVQNEQLLGVIVVTLTTGASLGSSLEDGDQSVALALPVDTTPVKGPIPATRPRADYVLVVHPVYSPRQEPVRLPSEQLPEFALDLAQEFEAGSRDVLHATERYLDPAGELSPRYQGPFWAGFAQVGRTEMLVIVQESPAKKLAEDREMLQQLSLWTVSTATLGLLVTGGVALLRQRHDAVIIGMNGV